MNKNPLSERSEFRVFVNALRRFRQALDFRSAATESRTERRAAHPRNHLFLNQTLHRVRIPSGTHKAHRGLDKRTDAADFFRRGCVKNLEIIFFKIFYHLLDTLSGKSRKGLVDEGQAGAAAVLR